MTANTNEPPATTVLFWLGLILVAGYFGYTTFFGSDRANVRSCISSIMEASRADVGYGEYRQKLGDVDQGDEIVITDETRRPFGPDFIVTIYYTVDGRPNSIMCAN